MGKWRGFMRFSLRSAVWQYLSLADGEHKYFVGNSNDEMRVMGRKGDWLYSATERYRYPK
jgi:hypothetical protein